MEKFHGALGELGEQQWQAYIWKRLAVSLFEQVESLTGATEVGVSLDPSMPWPDVTLTVTPTSAKLSRSNSK
ncbi:hypothetical protein ACOQFV_09010 [Nocardiopsis changdeensis]|uniref:Uncharacterized protein n=1 Tax=Nocardiopsis changdeensis TaxID=2831969 RepID=A0ABX8BE57_9ACTN|nr:MULTISPECIES: hypothetical protein [Nocardiopsis]QUX20319.1 hypothetical protein KGD84_17470 [Nocardiopsis changdeensis]QYX36249.1 hypothetical protein K1J57_26925 [Nocardiopsis sp. MT53]